jgi:flagella basal body P-ring formation protein FlgA
MLENSDLRIPDAECGRPGQGTKVRMPAPGILHLAACPQAIATLTILLTIVTRVSAVDVKLRERVAPKSSVVRLGDVAEISSADRQEARKLAAVPLMPAPAPETERFLRKREIADMLEASGVELASIHFDGAEQVAVGGASRVEQTVYIAPVSTQEKVPSPNPLPDGDGFQSRNRHAAILAGEQLPSALPDLDDTQADAVKSQLCRIVGDYLKAKSGKAIVGRVDCNASDRQLSQLAAATSPPVCDGGSDPWTGRQKVTLTFTTTTGRVSVPVFADVAEPPAPIVVATRSVARGDVVTAADVEVRMIEPSAKTSGQRAVIDSTSKIVGMEARQPLQAGEIVFADQVQAPVIVKRGDLITVSSQSGGIRVRTSARALQEGAKGDLIEVESLQGKQHYDARVIGLREAAVFAPARVSAPLKPERIQSARLPGNTVK